MSNAFTTFTYANNTTSTSADRMLTTSSYSKSSPLVSVDIGTNVTSIGSSCFQNCTVLTNVNIQSTSITSFGSSCFYGCDILTAITIPNSVTSLGSGCFLGCYSLTSISIPNSVTSIGTFCFQSCKALTTISINATSLTSLPNNCFYGCISVTSISIPNSVTSFGANCFGYCSSATSITFLGSVTSLSNNCFDGCSALTSMTIPNSVTTLGNSCFKNCSALTSMTIPASVTSLGTSCFQGCSEISSVTFISISSLRSLGNNCFYGCTKLTAIDLPTSVNSLGNSCFQSSGLTSIIIPTAVTNLNTSTFSDCTNLTSVQIMGSVTSLGVSCFYNCTNLTTFDIPNAVRSLSDSCFQNCSSLASITIPNLVTSLGTYCFYGCSALTSISMPSSLTTLGNDCLEDCTALTSVTIPSLVTSLGDNCFSGCTALTTVNIQATSLNSLPSGCFSNCNKLASINIPSSVSSLGNSCFSSCTVLSSVTLPDSLTSLSANCFYASGLTSMTIPASVTSIGISCFHFCVKLTSIVIPASVTILDGNCFNNCAMLTSVTIPRSVTTLGGNCFQGCTGLTTIHIENRSALTTAGPNIFFGIPSRIIDFYYNSASQLGLNTASLTLLHDQIEPIAKNIYYQAATLTLTGKVIPDFEYSGSNGLAVSLLDYLPESESTGAFTFASSDESVVSIAGNTMTLLNAGTATITFTQEATESYQSANTSSTVTVNPADPMITSWTLPDKQYLDGPFAPPLPLTNSDGSFRFASSDQTIALVVRNGISNEHSIFPLSVGSVTLTATQESTRNYLSGSISQTLNIRKATPSLGSLTITHPFIGTSRTIFEDPTTNSDGAITYVSSDPSVAVVNDHTLEILSKGVVTITAIQSETENFTSNSISTTLTCNLCFPAGTPVLTDQGKVAIEKLDIKIHTIHKQPILAVTKTILASDKYLVCFEANALGPNMPSERTLMSRNHKLLYKGKMVKAHQLLGKTDQIHKAKYHGEMLYNVLMATHSQMLINNLVCETLDPANDIARLHMDCMKLNREQQEELIAMYKQEFHRRNPSFAKRL